MKMKKIKQKPALPGNSGGTGAPEHERKLLRRSFCVPDKQPIAAEHKWNTVPNKNFRLDGYMPGRTRRFSPCRNPYPDANEEC
jgi:hypothetical protein